ncbi:MAG: hypothetical protein U0736_16725 [Gemmataceae bacterium]
MFRTSASRQRCLRPTRRSVASPLVRLARPWLERLEDRAVPAVTATLNAGLLQVVSDGADAIQITRDPVTNNVLVNNLNPSGVPAPCTAVNWILIQGGPGANVIDVSAIPTAGFLLSGPVQVMGGGGTDTLVGPNLETFWNLTGFGAGQLSVPSVPSVPPMSFTDVENLTGGGMFDGFFLADGSGVAGTLDGGGGGNDALAYAGYTTGVTVDLQARTATNVGGFIGIEQVNGGGNSDTLIGPDVSSTWTLNNGPPNTVNATFFFGFERLKGGSGDDTFAFTGNAGMPAIDGGGGTNGLNYAAFGSTITVDLKMGWANNVPSLSRIQAAVGSNYGVDFLIGDNTTNVWNLTSPGGGTLNGAFAFTGFEGLIGGSGNDTFAFADGVTGFATLDGGAGTDVFSCAAYTAPVFANLSTGQITVASGPALTAGYFGIERFVGGANVNDVLTGIHATNLWKISGTNAGELWGVASFAGFENLTGGNGDDTFVFQPGGSVSGLVNGTSGLNTLNYAALSTPVTVSFPMFTATAVGSFTGIGGVVGGSGSGDILVGPNVNSGWSVTATNAGTLNGSFTFSGIENLTGGSANDSFFLSDGVGVSGTITGGGGTDVLGFNYSSSSVTVNLQAGTATNVGGFAGIEQVNGGGGSDILIGPDVSSTWTLISGSPNTVNAISFGSFENLKGGAGDDTYVINTSIFAPSIDGGGGTNTLSYAAFAGPVTVNLQTGGATNIGSFSHIQAAIGSSTFGDTLIGGNTTNLWNLTVGGAGTLNGGFAFTSFEALTGGLGGDTFTFADGVVGFASLSGGGAGTDVLNYAAYTTTVFANLQNGTAMGVSAFTSIDRFVGGSATDTLFGANSSTTWNVTGPNSGTFGGSLSFAGFENLTGGSGDDTFAFQPGGSISGLVHGTSGVNTLNYAALSTPVTVSFPTLTATAVGSFTAVSGMVGGSGSGDTLVGPNVDNFWNVTGMNTGTLNGFTFSGVENLTSGGGSDLFQLANGAGVAGTLAGGGGSDALAFGAYTTGVTVNLPAGTATNVGAFTGIENFGGGNGSDTFIGPDAGGSWVLNPSPANSTLNASTGFVSFENLKGGAGDDTFALAGGSAASIDGGGGTNTLSYAAFFTGVTVDLQASWATGVDAFSHIQAAVGGGGTDQLVGPNTSTTWNLTGMNDGTLTGTFTYSGFEGLHGGSGSDTFVVAPGGGVSGMLDGGGGSNTLSHTAFSTPVWVDYQPATPYATGVGGFANIGTLIGGAGVDLLFGPNLSITWSLNGANAGFLDTGVSFVGYENLFGGGGNDNFQFYPGGSVAALVAGGGGSNALSYNYLPGPITCNLGTGIATAVGVFGGIQSVVGSAGSDTLIGADFLNTWTVNGFNSGTVNGGFSYTGFENLTGGAGPDTFALTGGTVTGTLNGAGGPDTLDYSALSSAVQIDLRAGSATAVAAFVNVEAFVGGSGGDTLRGADRPTVWTISGINAGDLDGTVSFSGIENLTGGADTDTFAFADGQGVTGDILGGGGVDTLDYAAYTSAIFLNRQTGATAGAAHATGIEALIGGTAIDNLIGGNGTATWTVSGPNAGTVNGFTFTDVEALIGGSGADTFAFAPGGSVAAMVSGGGGINTLSYASYGSAVTVNLAASTAAGIGGTFTAVQTIVAGAAVDTLVGPSSSVTWTVSGGNAGTVGGIAFAGFENLTGGGGIDTFAFQSGGSVSGTVHGGTGVNVLDYSALVTPVTVNLQAFSATAVGSFAAIAAVVGGSGSGDSLLGTSTNTTWTVSGANAGSLTGGFAFTAIENLTGGGGIDVFVISTGGTVSGTVQGGGGSGDLLAFASSSPVTVNLQAGTATNIGGFAGVERFAGGSGSDTLIGPDTASTWALNPAGFSSLNGSTTFNSFETLVGGAAADAVVGPNALAVWNLTGIGSGTLSGPGFPTMSFSGVESLTGGGGIDELAYIGTTTAVTVDLRTNTATNLGGFAGFERFTGGSGSDTLIGPDTVNAWALTSTVSSLNGATQFASFERLQGGAADDTFSLAAFASAASIDGGGGVNTLSYADYGSPVAVNLLLMNATNVGSFSRIQAAIGSGTGADWLTGGNTTNAWNLTAPGGGTLNGTFAFTSFEGLAGGSGSDTFTFADGVTGFATLSGGTAGTDVLNYVGYTTPVVVNLQIPAATGTAAFTGIDRFIGGGAADTLVGPAASALWSLTGADSGSVSGGSTYVGFENLAGGGGIDTFRLAAGATVSGIVAGGGGSDVLDFSASAAAVTFDLRTATASGVSGFTSIETLVGGSNSDTLFGPNGATAWTVSGADTGTVAGIAFSAVENLTGGSAVDTFAVADGVRLVGLIDGGGSGDVLNFSAWSAGVRVDLAAAPMPPWPPRRSPGYIPASSRSSAAVRRRCWSDRTPRPPGG